MYKCLNCGKVVAKEEQICPVCDMRLEGNWVLEVNIQETAADHLKTDSVAASPCWNCGEPVSELRTPSNCPSCSAPVKSQITSDSLKIVPIDRPNDETKKTRGPKF